MKLLLDEMLSPAIARELRSRGHDVRAVTELAEDAPLSDPEVMERARRERRAVVTDNLRDYRALHHDAVAPGGPGHFGVVLVRDTGRVVAALEAKLAEHPGERDLADGETWL